MALSTNSVFHFTKSIDSLKGILINNFRIKYCLEKIESKLGTVPYAVPMVSFCDIPLSQVSSHINKYGGYGIGLTKVWAKRRGLNPVLYLEKNSSILNDVLIKAKFEDSPDLVYEFLRYTKNYDGELIRDEIVINKQYRFYDEREWRFCPPIEKLNGSQKIIFNTDYYKQNKKDINERLLAQNLSFNLPDISYIILKEESEILEIIAHLESDTKIKLNPSLLKILTSKITTSKQIKTDF